MLCASFTSDPGCDFPAYACQTQSDQCVIDAECAAFQVCSIDSAGQARHCASQQCVIARPFLVAGEVRSAPCVTRPDWQSLDARTPEVDRLTRAELDCLAASELEPADSALRAHGVLSKAERIEIRRETLALVVLPCLDVLTQNTAGSAYVPKTCRSTSQISCSVA